MRRKPSSHDLIWCMLPALDLVKLRGPLPQKIAELEPWNRPFRLAQHVEFEGFLVITETENQRRALGRLVEQDSKPVNLIAPSAQAKKRILRGRRIRSAMKTVETTLRGKSSDAVIDSLINQLYKTAIAASVYNSLDLKNFRGVLVATQHSPIIRAALLAATSKNVPTVYVPHAPVAHNPAYWDLPVSVAGVRGQKERSYLASKLGVSETSIDVVGNLASDILELPMPRTDSSVPGTVAVSPHGLDTIERMFNVIQKASKLPMTVAPHPRSNLMDLRRIMPKHWEFIEHSTTLEHLKCSNTPFLIQMSSGVAWESSALGIPTATIVFEDEPLNYPFLEAKEIIPKISGVDETNQFIATALSESIDRCKLRSHALAWCDVDSEGAARNLSNLLDSISATITYPSRIHDGWSEEGIAYKESWISR